MKRTQATGYRKPAGPVGVCGVCGGTYAVRDGALRGHRIGGKGSEQCGGAYMPPVEGAETRR